VEPFGGGYDFIVDSNNLSRFRYGVCINSYGDDGFVHITMPLMNIVIQNNTITDSNYGIRDFDFGPTAGEAATNLGNIVRRNTMSGIHVAGWFINAITGNTMDLTIFEHNQETDAPTGIFVWQASTSPTYVVLYKNTINRGAAPLAGSAPIATPTPTGFTALGRGNLYLNFLNPQNPAGSTTSLLPTYSWNAIPGADHYSLWVYDWNTGALVESNGNVPTTSWTSTTALIQGHGYVWAVEALAGNTPVSNWSQGQYFVAAPLSPPTATSPNGAVPILNAGSLSPAFSWSPVSGADSYGVLVYDWNSGQAIRQTTAATTWSPATPLSAGHYYQWWVRALNNSGDVGLWSSGASFSFKFGTPTPVVPAGSVVRALPTFYWGGVAAADFYDVYVLDTTTGQPALRAPLSGPGVVTGTSWTPTTPLTPGHTFTWMVRAMAFSGSAGPWSQATSFTVVLLPTPTLSAPTGTVTTTTPALSWATVAAASYYDVWIDDLTAGKGQVVRNSQVPVQSLTTPTLTVGHTYRWRVRALNLFGDDSLWSGWMTFIVM
jgi:hypothetical protein